MKNRIIAMMAAIGFAVACIAATPQVSKAGIFGHRGGGSECANGNCSREVASSNTNSDSSSGGYGGSTPRRAHTLFGRRGSHESKSGGSSGDTRSSGSAGGNGGSSGGYGSAGGNGGNRAVETCDCTCPNCGCDCSRAARSVASSVCNCCEKCTGKPGCDCGCPNCKCNAQATSKTDELDPSRPPGMKSKGLERPAQPATK